jgi:hypothetical protein
LVTNTKCDGAAVKGLDTAIELGVTDVFINPSGRMVD